MRTLDVFYLVALWFIVLSIINKDNRFFAAILFLSSFINIIVFDFFDFTLSLSYLEAKELLIKLDGATALALTAIMVKESQAYKQAMVLAFMVLCHSMISLHLITGSYFMWAISKPFFALYNELIITLAILQIMVTWNGMADGIRRIQVRICRYSASSHGYSKSISTQKTGKG